MLKLAGCIMLISAGTYGGFSMAYKLARQKDYLYKLLKMAEDIEIYLRSEFLTAEEIISKLNSNQAFAELVFLKDISGEDVTTSVAENIRNDSSEYIVCIKDKLSEYFEDFGKWDMETQIAKTVLLKAEIKDMYELHKEKYHKYSKLYRVMGFSIGMMSAIVLI